MPIFREYTSEEIFFISANAIPGLLHKNRIEETQVDIYVNHSSFLFENDVCVPPLVTLWHYATMATCTHSDLHNPLYKLQTGDTLSTQPLWLLPSNLTFTMTESEHTHTHTQEISEPQVN